MWNEKPAHNSGLAQLGFEANFKVGFVFGSWFLIYTFGQPNPQLTPSHETLCDSRNQNWRIR